MGVYSVQAIECSSYLAEGYTSLVCRSKLMCSNPVECIALPCQGTTPPDCTDYCQSINKGEEEPVAAYGHTLIPLLSHQLSTTPYSHCPGAVSTVTLLLIIYLHLQGTSALATVSQGREVRKSPRRPTRRCDILPLNTSM